MKKIIFVLICMVVFPQFINAQEKVDFDELPFVKFPCTISSSDGNSFQVSQPILLSKYCSSMAEEKISKVESCFLTSAITLPLGVGVYELGVYFNDRVSRISGLAAEVLGAGLVVTSAVCGVLTVSNLVGHFKWEYRRKQVDFYLNPAGATIKF